MAFAIPIVVKFVNQTIKYDDEVVLPQRSYIINRGLNFILCATIT